MSALKVNKCLEAKKSIYIVKIANFKNLDFL